MLSRTTKSNTSETRQEECTCRTCGNGFTGEVSIFRYGNHPREFRPYECPQCKEKRDSEETLAEEHRLKLGRLAIRESWRRECNIPWGLQCTRFEEFDGEYQQKPLGICRQWADSFSIEKPQGIPSLVLFSTSPGVGKTTLMVCIANYIIDNWQGDPDNTFSCPIRIESGPGLVRRIRATYNINPTDPYHEREEDVYRQLLGVKLLLLDDVGKEQPQSYRFTREVYWYIIDERVKAGLPVIISSRLPMYGENSLEELMTVDAVDRLYGMCQGRIVKLGGTSYRQSHKIA